MNTQEKIVSNMRPNHWYSFKEIKTNFQSLSDQEIRNSVLSLISNSSLEYDSHSERVRLKSNSNQKEFQGEYEMPWM